VRPVRERRKSFLYPSAGNSRAQVLYKHLNRRALPLFLSLSPSIPDLRTYGNTALVEAVTPGTAWFEVTAPLPLGGACFTGTGEPVTERPWAAVVSRARATR